MSSTAHTFDVIIIGSGLAGLSAALRLAPTHRVAVITKNILGDGSSAWAQGGIAAVLGEGDSYQSHIQDTLIAGAGLCDLKATEFTVEHAPESIAWLQSLGVQFTQENGHVHLTREGGHSERRIVHVTDATGAAVQQVLVQRIKETANVTVFEQHMLIDLITDKTTASKATHCVGAYVLDQTKDEVVTFAAPQTILATGGAGKVYLFTTNPDTATGDGIAAAWRAGCRVANMEFIQFHPTCLYHPHAKSFLITEAVRGEGGHVVGEGVAGLGCGGEVGRLGERVITHGHHQKLGRQRFSGVPGRALALAATAFGAGGEVEEALPGEVLDFADAHEVVLARVLEVDLFAARIDGQEGAQGAGPAREGDIREGREDVQVLAVGDEHGESEEDGEPEEQKVGFEDFVRVRAEGAQRTGQPLGGKGATQELEGPIGVIARA